MGDKQWTVVGSHNRRSVFDRLGRGNWGSDETSLHNISLNLYVTKFTSHFTRFELWKTCDKFGTVVDIFIAKRKSKAGKMFAFVRFIKVEDSNMVINGICNTWVGKIRLYANGACFERNNKVSRYKCDRE